MSLIKVIDQITGVITWAESNDASQVHGVDANGDYIGLVPAGSATQVPSVPPAGPNWKWQAAKRRWVYVKNLVEAMKDAFQEIDANIGMIRQKYITTVAGQEDTYAMKLEEARAYVLAYATDVNAVVPPFIAAEAEASETTAILAAQDIIAQADAWRAKAVQIEKARRAGKVHVGKALTVNAVANRLETVLAAFSTL